MRRVLFALSADFGEYATASILSRGQPFERRFALPDALAAYAPAGLAATRYRDAAGIAREVQTMRPDLVVLASGYLYAINGLFGPEALARLVQACRAAGAAVATTDPWLRLRALVPGTRFAIGSIRADAVDAAQTARVEALQRRLEALLGGLPHLLAVPVAAPGTHAAFNPAFGAPAPARAAPAHDEWLFVLSREDYALCAGQGGLDALAARIEELLARPRNRLRFVGPEALGRFLGARFPGRERLAYLPFLDFAAFEAAVRSARIVVYWNVLSATLLYCLYLGVAPVFFGRGHQARACPGLYEHVVAQVYRGMAPVMLDPALPIEPDAGALIERHGIGGWLDGLRADYARLPTPAAVVEALCTR
jgi:hypothetical protein